MMKKFLICLLLVLPTVYLSGCDDDDEDEPGGTSGGSTSGWVKVDDSRFNVKYGYTYLYDEDEYGDDDGYSIICSDTDLTNYLMGKSFKKTVSYIQFVYDGYVSSSKLFGVIGCYKVKLDSSDIESTVYDKDGFAFMWLKSEPECNPGWSSFSNTKNGDAYIFEGESLQAAVGDLIDTDYDYEYARMADFSLSIETSPVFMSTRASDIEIIKDPKQIQRLKKLLDKSAQKK